AHHSMAVVFLDCREARAVQEEAEAEIALATEQGLRQFWVWGTIRRGWALVRQGQGSEGLAQLQEGWAALQATGAQMTQALFRATLAEAYGRAGQTEEGLAVLTEALESVDKLGDRVNEAELYRLKGELTLQSQVQGPRLSKKGRVGTAHRNGTVAEAATVGEAHPTRGEEAEPCFLKAVEIARKQQAKSLELRAVVSLSRLWQRQGKKKEAHERLAEVYNWCTEGFDTKDLQEAKALLDELGSP